MEYNTGTCTTDSNCAAHQSSYIDSTCVDSHCECTGKYQREVNQYTCLPEGNGCQICERPQSFDRDLKGIFYEDTAHTQLVGGGYEQYFCDNPNSASSELYVISTLYNVAFFFVCVWSGSRKTAKTKKETTYKTQSNTKKHTHTHTHTEKCQKM